MLGTVPGMGEALSARLAVTIFSDDSKGRGRRRGKREGGGEKGRSREGERQKRGERDGPGPGALGTGLRRPQKPTLWVALVNLLLFGLK